jgi:hypothetical protein
LVELVINLELKELFLGERVQEMVWSEEELTMHLLLSTVTDMLLGLTEKPVPKTTMYCPPKFPFGVKMDEIAGRAVNSKYSPLTRELLLILGFFSA